MAELCIIYASEDKRIAGELVSLLRSSWDVWWDGDIAQGDWQDVVRNEISNSKGTIALFSRHTERKSIFRDELSLAKRSNCLIFPFFIEPTEPPLGYGHLNRTNAFGWKGDGAHPGYKQLVQKLTAGLGSERDATGELRRPPHLTLGNKTLALPAFLFSLSSHETQVPPIKGMELMRHLRPAATLVSAYDAWMSLGKPEFRDFKKKFSGLTKTESIVFLDSGNYEACRKNDRYSRSNNKGNWRCTHFWDMIEALSPDIAFAFDDPFPRGDSEKVTKSIVKKFRADIKAINSRSMPICPIIHLPRVDASEIGECASYIVSEVAARIDPIMVAIPERELGNGLIEKIRTVRRIRASLNTIGRYYPLHLLGTGNPFTMIALAAAGADSFDGLEWCRTVADYDSGCLFHFQHFDCIQERCSTRLRSDVVKLIIKNASAPYALRVASYNFDFFTDWTKTMQDLIRSGQVEYMVKGVPGIGSAVLRELVG